MPVRKSLWTLLPAALLAATTARAQPAATTVSVRDAWARATPPGATVGVVYLTLTSPQGDTLTAVSTPAAATAGVHQELTQGGIMRMRPVIGGLPLPPGKPVALAPGGLHIMLEGLKAPLQQGSTITLHLVFAKSPAQDAAAAILPIGATGPGMSMDMPMGH